MNQQQFSEVTGTDDALDSHWHTGHPLDSKLVARATRLVGAYVVSLAILVSAIIAGYVLLREELDTQKLISEANTHVNVIHRTVNDSVGLLQDFRDAAVAIPLKPRLVQVIERLINKAIAEIETHASLLKESMDSLEGSAYWDDFKWITSTKEEDQTVLLERYVKRMRALVNAKDELGQAVVQPQIPAEAAGSPQGSLSNGLRESSEQLSEIIIRHSDRIDVLHKRLTFLILGMFLLLSFLVVLPLWKRLIKEHARHELAHKKLHQLAYTDQETGLPNLDGFGQYILNGTIPLKSVRNYFLLLVQIKNLHEIYNLIGSQRIPELHQVFSERLKSSELGEKIWARSGNSEYAITIHQHIIDKSNHWIEQFFNDLSRPLVISSILVRPSIAIAVSQLDEPKDKGSSLLHEHQANARLALPIFDRTILKLPAYKSALTQELTKQNELITSVSYGVDNREFVPYYQVKVDALSAEPSSMEVLCRWSRADGEMVEPDVFIAAAEKSGQIVPMTYQLLEQVVHDVETWSQRGLRIGPLAINVSIDVLQHKDFIIQLSHARERLVSLGSDLEIEITENVAIDDNTDMIRHVLQSIRKRGLRIAIDDFGTGYASLRTLIDLPFDILKIDRSFLVSMTEAGVGSEVLSAIISLCMKFKKRSVVEGVEFEWQMKKLIEMGADELQGYLFHKPACAKDVAVWLESNVKQSEFSV